MLHYIQDAQLKFKTKETSFCRPMTRWELFVMYKAFTYHNRDCLWFPCIVFLIRSKGLWAILLCRIRKQKLHDTLGLLLLQWDKHCVSYHSCYLFITNTYLQYVMNNSVVLHRSSRPCSQIILKPVKHMQKVRKRKPYSMYNVLYKKP